MDDEEGGHGHDGFLCVCATQVPPPRRSEVVLPPLETQLHPPEAGFRAVQPVPVSISLPASPGSFGVPTPTSTATADSTDLRRQAMVANAARGPHRLAAQDKGSNSVRFMQPDRDADAMMFRSQPIPAPPPARLESRAAGRSRSRAAAAMNWDRQYDSFKTWSGKLERQITHLAGGPPDGFDDEGGEDDVGSRRTSATSVPEVDRFYAALEGPELDQLKVRVCLQCFSCPFR